jgi:hypothetical protein
VAADVSLLRRGGSAWDRVQKWWIDDIDVRWSGGKVAAAARAMSLKVIVFRLARTRARDSGSLWNLDEVPLRLWRRCPALASTAFDSLFKRD